jgi:catechol 2,3-dioxygenase-like lactoylglutathione lyase family enzyme
VSCGHYRRPFLKINDTAKSLCNFISPPRKRSVRFGKSPRLLGRASIETADEQSTVMALKQANTGFISPGVISFANRDVGYRQGIFVRDPDGHAIEIVTPRDN